MNKQGFAIVVVFFIVCMAIPLSEAKENKSKIQSSWCTPMLNAGPTLTPRTVYRGESTTFTSTLTEAISASLDVQYYNMKMGWESSYHNLGGGTIPGGQTKTFTLTITIPQIATGPYTASADVYAQSVGDWWAEHCTWSWTNPVNVNDRPPLTVSVQANPTSGSSPLDVSFTSSVSGGTPDYTYAWTFGDGATSTQPNPTHTYTTQGSFTAKLVVTDKMNRQQSDEIQIQVYAPLAVTVQANPTSGNSPLSVSFTSSVTGGTPSYTYSWTFGDGGTSTEQNPTHRYTSAGTYTAKLIVTDQLGHQLSDSILIQVSSSPLGGLGNGSDGSSALIILGVIAIIVIVIILLLLLLRKKKKSSPATSTTTPVLVQQYPSTSPPTQYPTPTQYPPPPPPPQYVPPPQHPTSPPPPPISQQKDDGTTLIDRLKERQKEDKKQGEKFDAYKPAVVSGQNIVDDKQPKRR